MMDLATILHTALRGHVCFIGIGNESAGDDGFGMKLARALAAASQADVVLAGTDPERWLTSQSLAGYDHVVFLDAMDFGGAPGSVVFLDSTEIQSRFPQISTHKLSLGLLAQLVETSQSTKAWLLGVQAASLKPAAELSPALQVTLSILRELLFQILPHPCESTRSAEEVESVYEKCSRSIASLLGVPPLGGSSAPPPQDGPPDRILEAPSEPSYAGCCETRAIPKPTLTP